MSNLVVGSRGSRLALCQTRQVLDQLIAMNPGLSCRIEVIKTTGDRILDAPLGDKGLFVKEIEQALLDGEIDFAVHSAKDMPSEMDDSLIVAAYPKREDPADALVSNIGGLADLPHGAKVGTSSLRRRVQLLRVRPDLDFVDMRGNLDTRLKKLDRSEYDAIVLARAGLRRMGLESRISEVLNFDVCLPAAGQGALAVQCRKNDSVAEVLSKIDDRATRRCVEAERAFLTAIGAGCHTPVAALAVEMDGKIELNVLVADLDGSNVVRQSCTGSLESPEEVGRRAAHCLSVQVSLPGLSALHSQLFPEGAV